MRISESTLDQLRRKNTKIMLFDFSNGKRFITVAAYTEDHARDIIDSYAEHGHAFGSSDDYILESTFTASSTGIKTDHEG